MFILATHCQYKNRLQQFYGDSLVEVIKKGKEFDDQDNKISLKQNGNLLIFTWRDSEQVTIDITDGNYLVKVCDFLDEASEWLSDGNYEYKSQYIIFDTDNPDQGYRRAGGKVEGASLATVRDRANRRTPNVNYTLKSIKTGEQAAWLAMPPKFLSDEGCFTTYEQGKSVDAWLGNPSNDKQKAKFLAKLNMKTGKEPTQEQLGAVSLEAVKKLQLTKFVKTNPKKT
ncbi:hypothetical protein A9Y76_07265 [Ralstonia insidiosa]|uniref:Uncharacterized protein n=1 Tax=Ralstonia insidiosa TaxID=190721 RepID=A0A191ZW18_9RALS|nr:hypothetical protein [Ralstonia insidiosa]ANJ72278.1 hypothetical protein A9Y76_07265 [Ralstonia insidiosa]